MNSINTIEAKRTYIVTDARMQKCEICKQLYARLFELVPSIRNNAFDTVLVCVNCLDKVQMEYNIDIVELREAGSVAAWMKLRKN